MVSKAPRMISVVMGSAAVARPARAGRGRGAGLPARGRRARRVFGREARGMGCGYIEAQGVTRAGRPVAVAERVAASRSSLPQRPEPRQRHLVVHLVEDRKSTRLNSSHTVISYA